MNEIIPGCPFALKMKWVVYFVAGLIGYITVTYILKDRKEQKENILDRFATSIIVYVSVWKLSYGLFHPLKVIEFPLSLIYFNGGIKGKWLAGIVVALYLFYHAYKNKEFIGSYVKSVSTAFISVMSVYFLMALIIEKSDYLVFITLFIIGAVMVYVSFKNRNHTGSTFFFQLLMWYSLLSTGLLFFDSNLTRFMGFTDAQWMFLIIGIVSFILSSIKRFNFIDS